MSNKSKVEEIEDEPKKGQTEESTELNDDHIETSDTEENNEECKVNRLQQATSCLHIFYKSTNRFLGDRPHQSTECQ